MRPNAVLETSSGGRKVMLYIFSRHFMLRWYVQLRLSTENEHFFRRRNLDFQLKCSSEIRFEVPEVTIFLGKSWFCSISTSRWRGESFTDSLLQSNISDMIRAVSKYELLCPSERGERCEWSYILQNDDFWTKMVTFDTSDLVSETDLRPKSWCPTKKMFVLNAETELRVPPEHKVSRKNIYNHFPTVSECL